MSVTEVHRFNLHVALPAIHALVRTARFISIDTEFTGLGNPAALRSKDAQVRYTNMRQLVDTHALVALGVSIFVDTGTKLRVHNFNFTLLCEREFTVTPDSLKFLVDTGFDFNYQMRMGIPYSPVQIDVADGGDKTTTATGRRKPAVSPDTAAISRLIGALFDQRCPIVVHNGWLDLMFVYHSFYGQLPTSLDVFTADLDELVSGGIYDTKFIADFHAREPASYLAFLFRKYERAASHVGETIDVAPEIVIPTDLYTLPPLAPKQLAICGEGPFCLCYARHGFCKLGRRCHKSHNLDLILDHADIIFAPNSAVRHARKRRRKQREAKALSGDDMSDDDNDIGDADDSEDAIQPPQPETKNPDVHLFVSKPDAYHAAGYDAYMTGFIFAHQMRMPFWDQSSLRNKLYIISKPFPLLVRKGVLAKTSAVHRYHQSKKHEIPTV